MPYEKDFKGARDHNSNFHRVDFIGVSLIGSEFEVDYSIRIYKNKEAYKEKAECVYKENIFVGDEYIRRNFKSLLNSLKGLVETHMREELEYYSNAKQTGEDS